MGKRAVCVLAAMTAATSFAVPSSAAPVAGPEGRKCSFNSATDVMREPGWQVGDINAGPLVTLADGTLYCKIVVNGWTHSSPAAAVESVAAVGGVAVMAPRPLNYRATAADDISMCTRWDPADPAKPTLYWVNRYPFEGTPPNPPNAGHWDDDPDAICNLVYFGEEDGFECGLWKAIDRRTGTNIAEIWQDCEPYEEYDPCVTLGDPPGVCPLPAITPSRQRYP
jgi:hypothetical protein